MSESEAAEVSRRLTTTKKLCIDLDTMPRSARQEPTRVTRQQQATKQQQQQQQLQQRQRQHRQSCNKDDAKHTTRINL